MQRLLSSHVLARLKLMLRTVEGLRASHRVSLLFLAINCDDLLHTGVRLVELVRFTLVNGQVSFH